MTLDKKLVSEIQKYSKNPDKVEEELELFRRNDFYLQLERACSMGDGIYSLRKEDDTELEAFFDEAAKRNRISKFVPASGAASRMFKSLSACLNRFPMLKKDDLYRDMEDRSLDECRLFFENLTRFAFLSDLQKCLEKKDESFNQCYETGDYAKILRALLEKEGMNYASKAKALIPFHLYEKSCAQTPIDEHISEMIELLAENSKELSLHFTTQEKFQSEFRKQLQKYEQKHPNYSYQIQFSKQSSDSDTIAVTKENEPFRQENGTLLFRPAGHGALIQNLNMLKADIVYIKTIDNVILDRKDSILYKIRLAGLLLKIQGVIFSTLEKIEQSELNEELLDASFRHLEKYFPMNLSSLSFEEKKNYFIEHFNRPIRICGMVKNEGEPGGGPYWVKEKDGRITMQIVEKAQVNLADYEQAKIVQEASHFNPVDIVCGLSDYKARSFDLKQYIDHSAVFISEKSFEGKTLKALELPGLWNGAMSKWLTVFVDVPSSTFSPVKSVTDLLKEAHTKKA